MAEVWARSVGRLRWWIVIGWIVVAMSARLLAHSWDQIAYDGDFDYLPSKMTSVAGGLMFDEAFPGDRSRSQVVLLFGQETGELNKLVGLDLLRRLYHR